MIVNELLNGRLMVGNDGYRENHHFQWESRPKIGVCHNCVSFSEVIILIIIG